MLNDHENDQYDGLRYVGDWREMLRRLDALRWVLRNDDVYDDVKDTDAWREALAELCDQLLGESELMRLH